MPRIRTIKPEFFTSPDVARLSLGARLTFIGLWVYADDFGRGRDDTRLIKAAIWPLEDEMSLQTVENDLRTLARAGLIQRYRTRDGATFLAIAKWAKHQRVSHPAQSKYPPPPPSRNPREASGVAPEVLASHSGGPVSGKEQGTGNRERNREQGALRGFAEAWDAYPRRPNNPRAKAERAWMARLAEGVAPEALLGGVRAYAAYVARTDTPDKFVKLAATFFGPDRHWETDYGQPADDQVPVYGPDGEMTPEFARATGLTR